MMGVLYLAVLVVAAVVGFIARGMILGATQGNAIAVVISGLIYGLLIVALMIVTIVMVLQRFYKNLLIFYGAYSSSFWQPHRYTFHDPSVS